MSKYFSHPSGGHCWSRERGYHTPGPLPVFHPAHPQAIALRAAKQKAEVVQLPIEEPEQSGGDTAVQTAETPA